MINKARELWDIRLKSHFVPGVFPSVLAGCEPEREERASVMMDLQPHD